MGMLGKRVLVAVLLWQQQQQQARGYGARY
jgi:hypothetical protein